MNDTKFLKATHYGELKIGKSDIAISCAVLEDKTRVLFQRTLSRALGVKGGGQYWHKKKLSKNSAVLPEFVSASYLQPYIDDELRTTLLKPVCYINIGGDKVDGIDASLLPEICDIWIRARDGGALNEKQKRIARNAYILMRGFAHVGIIALIDEATGYQDDRVKDALAKILEDFIRKEKKPYIGTFPTEFYRQIFRLHKWAWDPASTKRPGIIGTWTNDIVYARLAPEILKALQQKNPTYKPGRRKAKHFQWLTDEVGDPQLRAHFSGVLALMRAAPNWGAFKRMLTRAYPKHGDKLELEYLDIEESEVKK